MPQPAPLIDRLMPAVRAPSLGALTDAATVSALEVLSAPGFSQFIGKLAQARVPGPLLQAAIRQYIKVFNVDTSEIAEAVESFSTFDEFFTRALRPGIHVIDETPNVAVSPVDARVMSFGAVSDGRIDQVKGKDYRLDELLDSGEDAKRFGRGGFITLYLSPRDYHRIHMPAEGGVTGYRYVPGRLYPVNRYGLKHVDRLFAVNERLITFVENKTLGEFAVVKVGATNVGMITASYYPITTNVGKHTAYDERFRRKIPVARGDELGRFHLGSTVVLVWSNPNLKLVPVVRDQFFRMGELLLS